MIIIFIIDNPNVVNEFRTIPYNRTNLENVNYTFIIIIQIFGILSAALLSSTGLSLYALALVINYILSMSSLPYFVFSLRFILDTLSFYLALVLRSKLMYIYMPMHRN